MTGDNRRDRAEAAFSEALAKRQQASDTLERVKRRQSAAVAELDTLEAIRRPLAISAAIDGTASEELKAITRRRDDALSLIDDLALAVAETESAMAASETAAVAARHALEEADLAELYERRQKIVLDWERTIAPAGSILAGFNAVQQQIDRHPATTRMTRVRSIVLDELPDHYGALKSVTSDAVLTALAPRRINRRWERGE